MNRETNTYAHTQTYVKVLTKFHSEKIKPYGWSKSPDKISFSQDVTIIGFAACQCAMTKIDTEVAVSTLKETPATVKGEEATIWGETMQKDGSKSASMFFPSGYSYHLPKGSELWIHYYASSVGDAGWSTKIYYVL